MQMERQGHFGAVEGRRGRTILIGRHTPHLYLAAAGVVGGIMSAAVTLWAYYDERLEATRIAFSAVAVTTAILFLTFFWGCFLVMSGVIPVRRLGYLAFHVTLGCLTPLLYTLWISARLSAPNQPVGDLELSLSLLALPVLIIQLVSGWSVLGRSPWRALTGGIRRR
jgi:hypothetical protein